MSDGLRLRLQAALGSAYVVERELARGRTSRVFTATETALGRRVVLKVLPPEIATNDPLARFRREILLAARLQHPHIVPVYAAGEADDIRYFTMPFIDGDSLHARLERRGRLTPVEASRVLRDIGGALAYAHQRGVVHRDVKPANIFLERATGRALLADFGVARALGEPDGLTHAGVTVGTPVYMSPEQVDGADVDGRSDVYSLGLVGWEMLTGERPWAGESLYTVMYNQKFEPLPGLDSYGIEAPASLTAAIERALRKDRSARWPSADAFVDALGVKASTASRGSSDAPVWRDAAAATPPPRDQDAEAVVATRATKATDATSVPTLATYGAWPGTPVFRAPARGGRPRGRRIALLAAALTVAAGAAVIGGTAAAGGPFWPRPAGTGGEIPPPPASPATTEPEADIAVAILPDSAAADRLGGLEEGAATVGITANSRQLRPAPARYVSSATSSVTPRPAPRRAPSHVDALRARAATASSALRAYQGLARPYGARGTATVSAADVTGRSTSAAAPGSPVNDTNVASDAAAASGSDTPARAVPPAESAASAPAASPVTNGPDTAGPPAESPPVESPRVESPRAESPPAGDAASGAPASSASEPTPVPADAQPRAVRVAPPPAGPGTTASSHVTASWCRPWFPGSHICRVYNPRTGKVDTYYRQESQ
jgi:protein kinase-like protein